MPRAPLGRRELLALGGKLAAALSLPALPLLSACDRRQDAQPAATGEATPSGSQPATPVPAAPAAPRFFTAQELSIVVAAVARLLPQGDASGLPGGDRAGVAEFIDRQLALPSFAGLQRMMRAGVGFVDRTARRDHGGAFVAIRPDAQDAVLSAFQTGAVGGLRFPQARFFEQLLTFALEGYLGAPRHGGNRDAMVWRALGIDPRCHNMYQC